MNSANFATPARIKCIAIRKDRLLSGPTKETRKAVLLTINKIVYCVLRRYRMEAEDEYYRLNEIYFESKRQLDLSFNLHVKSVLELSSSNSLPLNYKRKEKKEVPGIFWGGSAGAAYWVYVF